MLPLVLTRDSALQRHRSLVGVKCFLYRFFLHIGSIKAENFALYADFAC